MKPRPNLVPIPKAQANKYFSYREAWGRIRKARGHGFYLEAVTLEESIIADRLISFLICVGAIQADSPIEKYGLGQLVQRWRKSVPEPIPTKDFHDLKTAVDEWRQRRNNVVHGLVKSAPGADHKDPLNFLKEAEFVAFQGDALAKAISDWSRKTRRQLSRGQ